MLPEPETITFLPADDLETFEGIIVDVRTPEAYSEAYIENAVNHPVYQVDFMEKFPEAYPDKSTKVLVYGDGDPYKADLAAVGRLQFLGYTNVCILEGGLSQWQAESRPVLGSGSASAAPVSGKLILDTDRTKVRWVGRNLTNQHNGEIASRSGFLEIDASGNPLSGQVTVNMRQMVCLDLADKSLAAGLIGHLASSDFFEVEKYPEASFELGKATPIENATYGLPNFSVSGVLSARGLALPITIEALIEPIQDGYVFQSVFSFDRTQLGVLYGSGRIFERLGMHLVNDLVSLDILAFFTVSK
ncbi:MAG: YceI family protein [Verrucomicrobiota bacterium]